MPINEKKIRKALADVLSARNIKIFIFVVFFVILFLLKKDMFIILFFVILGAVSMLYRLVFDVGVGFELVTMSTVLCGMRYGSKYGMLVGFLSVAIGLALNIRLFKAPIDSLYHLIGFTLIGYVAGLFSIANIFSVGIIINLVYNTLYFPFRLMFGTNVVKLLIFIASNIFFNYIIFKSIVPVFVNMVA